MGIYTHPTGQTQHKNDAQVLQDKAKLRIATENHQFAVHISIIYTFLIISISIVFIFAYLTIYVF